MIILKVVVLQIAWFLSVYSYKMDLELLTISGALVIAIANFIIYRPKIHVGNYIGLIIIFSSWGLIQDSFLANTLRTSPFWLTPLWIIFIAYYGDIFNKLNGLKRWQQAILGGVSGAFAYYSGTKLIGLELSNQELYLLLTTVGVSWAIFLPVSLRLFYNTKYWNKLLDRSIYFSFDATGFERHKNEYFINEQVQLEAKAFLVTGGTSGIGKDLAIRLANAGAKVIITGRNANKAQEFITNYANIDFKELDMCDWQKFQDFVKDLPELEGLICNAGGMPENKELVQNQIETQCASQLIGHYKLMCLLRSEELLKAKSRITIVSSGGMYLQKLDLDNLINPNSYDKVETYANVKRAQVTLFEELKDTKEWIDYTITSMHPGWVDTPGLRDAIPGFYNFTKKRLRNLYQGADTLFWLMTTNEKVQSGAFYFDRRPVSPYISDKYRPSVDKRNKLLKMIKSY